MQWWREQGLALRQVIGKDGLLTPVQFGTSEFPSLDAARANEAYARLAGLKVKEAQKTIVELLRDPAGSATGAAEPPLVSEPQPIEHPVKFYEKGDRPLEFITTRQWFVQLLEHKEALLAAGERIHWHPDVMGLRFRNWTENLNLDWCVSRQRFFGVPFPVWYRVKPDGATDFDAADPRRRERSAGRSDDRRAARLHRGAARPARRLHRARPTSSTPGSRRRSRRRSRAAGRRRPSATSGSSRRTSGRRATRSSAPGPSTRS